MARAAPVLCVGSAPRTQQDIDALYESGRRFLHGVGCERLPHVAFEQLRLAADAGHVGAMLTVGVCYQTGTGVAPDIVKAFDAFKRAMDGGSVEATCFVADCLRNGDGVERNPERAVQFYELAASKNFAEGFFQLGYCYYSGVGVPKHAATAVRYFHNAVARGHSRAMYVLGLCYERGLGGLPIDCVQAIVLYTDASRLGCQEATDRLNRIRATFREIKVKERSKHASP